MSMQIARNSGVQALRAIAALLVLYQHTFNLCYVAKEITTPVYLPINFGLIGVNIFFVISGYVMILCLHQGKMFLPLRMARIYPAFWISIAAGASLLFISLPWYTDIKLLLLVPTVEVQGIYLIPLWTLIYEMTFYFIMALLAVSGLSKPAMTRALLAWAGVIVVICLSRVYSPFSHAMGAINPGLWVFVSPFNLMFIAGALYGITGQDFLQRQQWPTILIVGALCWNLGQWLHAPNFLHVLFYAASYVCLLDLVRRVNPPRILVAIGDYSYGLYLIHILFITLLIAAVPLLVQKLAFWNLVGVVFVIALPGGLLFGAFEHWMHSRLIKPLLKLRRPVVKATPAPCLSPQF